VENNHGMVRLESLTKQYRGTSQPAIFQLSLDIPEGSVFGLLGPNGAGKSTLVMMLCGLMKPDRGTISIAGMEIGNGSEVRRHIGVAPQDIALYPALTARENLFYFGRMYGMRKEAIETNINHYLDAFGLTDKKDKRVHTFSGGMKRRLNLIAALLHDPRLLILDEPTAGVDVHSRNLVVDFLRTLKDKNITILYTSHFLDEAERLCSHIAILDEGQKLAEGTPAQLIQKNPGCRSLEELFLKLTGKTIRD
jgi:ABC-2 type transport system ATP-binding protein